MIRTLKIRLEPNNKQETMLFKSANISRWAYNWALDREEENYKPGKKFISDCDLRKELTELKKTDEYSWLYDVSNNVTKQAIKDACNAYQRYFKGLANHPNFKSKRKSTPSFYQDTSSIKFTESHVHLSKIGKIRLSESGRVPISSKYYNPRVKYDGLHWYLTVGLEAEQMKPYLSDESIGIDVGVKILAAVSNREEPYKNINKTQKVLNLDKKMKRLQCQLSRKYEMNKQGDKFVKTKNIKKLEKKICVVQTRLNNIRIDYLHKVSSEIVKTKPSRIVMENLNIKGMTKDRCLAKSLHNQYLYAFKSFVKYKAEREGIEFIEADRWYPSSKTCSHCGYIKPKLLRSERVFKCECCGFELDRDKNAALNLASYEVK